MHIPKTGGISVERSIAAAVPAGTTTCPTYFAPDFADKTYDDVPGYDIYHGHFDFGFLKTVPDTYKRIIVLRQPADQILSLCNHIASRKEHALHDEAQGSSLAELLNKNQGLHNQMTKHLLGKPRFKEVMLGKGSVKDKVAAVMPEIKANLETFEVVGITPRLNRFVREAGKVLDLTLPAPLRENKNKFITYKSDALSEEDQKALRFASWADRPVYRTIWAEVLASKLEKKQQSA